MEAIESDILWLESLLGARSHFPSDREEEIWASIPDHGDDDSPYVRFLQAYDVRPRARVVILLALAPVLRPSLLELLRLRGHDQEPIPEFGGYQGLVHKGLLPTIETALFLIAGHDLELRMQFLHGFFSNRNPLFGQHWLKLEQVGPHDPVTASLILPSRDLIDIVTVGRLGVPDFGPSFPAERLQTNRTWDELVLPYETMMEVTEIMQWIQHEGHVMREMRLSEKVAPGFRALFYGPPGTGKTFTASLLGKETGRDVYRIDLSMVVSKYIGETEKNLKVVFDKAQSRGWILFFDEADALFGKRTDVSDSKDRYANQEVSYLLQRVENFDGIVILATNNRDNMDDAFTRRFQSVIHFPMPAAKERLELWQKAIPETYEATTSMNLKAIADRFDIAGGNIINVVRYSALHAAIRGSKSLAEADILEGLKREYRKIGKI